MQDSGVIEGCFYVSHGYAWHDTSCHGKYRPALCSRPAAISCSLEHAWEKAFAAQDAARKKQD